MQSHGQAWAMNYIYFLPWTGKRQHGFSRRKTSKLALARNLRIVDTTVASGKPGGLRRITAQLKRCLPVQATGDRSRLSGRGPGHPKNARMTNLVTA